MATKPDKLPEWATGNEAEIIEPQNSQKERGWKFGDKPPAQWMNWWKNKVFEWIAYFDQARTESGADFFQPSWDGGASLSISVAPGRYTLGDRSILIGNSLTFTYQSGDLPLSSDERIDLFVLNASAVLQRVPGQAATSPVVPDHRGNWLPVAEVRLNSSGIVALIDVRPRGHRGGAVAVAGDTMTGTLNVQVPTGTTAVAVNSGAIEITTQGTGDWLKIRRPSASLKDRIVEFLDQTNVSQGYVGRLETSSPGMVLYNAVGTDSYLRIADNAGGLLFHDGAALRSVFHTGSAIGQGNLATNSVGTNQLIGGNVTADKIGNQQVTAPKLKFNAQTWSVPTVPANGSKGQIITRGGSGTNSIPTSALIFLITTTNPIVNNGTLDGPLASLSALTINSGNPVIVAYNPTESAVTIQGLIWYIEAS